jgi:hypothetical protein
MDGIEDQSDERIRWPPLLLLAGAALLLFIVTATAAILVEKDQTGGLFDDPTVSRTDIGAEQIGIVEPRLIELEERALRLHAERKAQLNGYSWVDRESGVIRIPVERGMERVVEGRR